MELLLPYCSDRQSEMIQLRLEGVSNKDIADRLNISVRNLQAAIGRARQNRLERLDSPEHGLHHPVPEGFTGGATIQRGPSGEIERTWTRNWPKKEAAVLALMENVRSGMDDYKGMGGREKAPRLKAKSKDYLAVYPMGDPHLGMYAWGEESGDDFDLDIAERNLVEASHRLIDTLPESETAIILNLGDFFHSDNMSNQTARSGNPLDVDTRWGRVFQVGIQSMIRIIDLARAKHKRVIVKNLIGNHDDHTSVALAWALWCWFDKDPRVQIETQPAKFWYHQFYKVLIGGAHGDTAKPAQLGAIMAADVPELWGATTHRYFYTGHIHTQNQAEFPGMIWESFKTLAGKDAWHSAKGYRSGRDMFGILHHRDHGEVERHRVDITMLGS